MRAQNRSHSFDLVNKCELKIGVIVLIKYSNASSKINRSQSFDLVLNDALIKGYNNYQINVNDG